MKTLLITLCLLLLIGIVSLPFVADVSRWIPCTINTHALAQKAEEGDMGSAFLLSGAYANGVCIEKDTIKAFAWGHVALILLNEASQKLPPEAIAQVLDEKNKILFQDEHPLKKIIVHTVEDTRNLQRRSDVNSILNAVYQYAVDNGGSLPSSIPEGAPTEICSTVSSQCTNLVDLNVLVPAYLAAIPQDPYYKGSNGTQYLISTVEVQAKTLVKVTAANAEHGASISVQR